MTILHNQPIFSAWDTNDFGAQWHKHRSMAVGLLFTLLVHLLLLYMLLQSKNERISEAKKNSQAGVMVYIPTETPEEPSAKNLPEPKRVSKAKPIRPSQPVVTASPPPSITQPTPVPPPIEHPVVVEAPPAPAPVAKPQVDMFATLNAKRQARAEADAREQADAQARGRGPSADDIATANINRNLQTISNARDGTSGVFTLLSQGTRVATFAFNGWTHSSNKWRDVIEVDAGLGGNVELAVVKRMIVLIRTHYQGDFNWESHKLGRVIVLSARQEDNAGLEEFLIKEFFG